VTKLTMPFFQATATKLPLTHEVTGAYPSAGPYAFTRNDPNVLTSLRRNPFWKRGPGRLRPRHLAGLDVHWGLDEQAAFDGVQANQLDEALPPSAEIAALAARYGVNKSRFWAMPFNCVGWVLFNNEHGLFENNVAMRQAVNWALDRKEYASLSGPYAGFPWTHLLPPRSPGSIRARNLQPYWPGPDLAKARRLARGHFKGGKITIAYWGNGSIRPVEARSVRDDLVKLGFKAENITLRPYVCEVGPCLQPAEWDVIAGTGWCTDYPDPYAVFRTFVGANPFVESPSLGSAKYVAKARAAARLVGNRRLRAFGKLDLEIMNRLAPVAVMRTYNSRYFFSNRVDPRSLSYSGVYSDWSIPALALK
jgi:ABC-type transport system substrate-binding protein